MKIGSKIHPRDGKSRTYTILDRRYVFGPEADKNGDTHFVADVANKSHQQLLLSHEAFYAFSPDMERQPQLARSNVSADANKLPSLPLPKPEDVEQAAVLLKGSVSDIGQQVQKYSIDVVRAALAVESANQKPRKNVVELLKLTLEGAKQAGVV